MYPQLLCCISHYAFGKYHSSEEFIHLSQLQQLILLSVFKCEGSNEKFLSPDAPKAYVKKDYLSVDSHHTPSKRFRYTRFHNVYPTGQMSYPSY